MVCHKSHRIYSSAFAGGISEFKFNELHLENIIHPSQNGESASYQHQAVESKEREETDCKCQRNFILFICGIPRRSRHAKLA